MRVRPLSASDALEYRKLMLEAYESVPDAFVSTAEERAAEPEEWWAKRIHHPKGLSLAFGGFADSQLVGTATIEYSSKPKTRHKALLIGMFVQAQARGTGLGRELVQAALQHAEARPEVLVVTLTVTDGNLPAIKLYESCGFKSFGIEPLAIATPSGFKSKVHMWHQLRPAPLA